MANGRIKFTHKFDAAFTALVEEIGGLPVLEMTLLTSSSVPMTILMQKDLLEANWSSVWDEGRVSRSDTPVTVVKMVVLLLLLIALLL
jgi:hypothetical protein